MWFLTAIRPYCHTVCHHFLKAKLYCCCRLFRGRAQEPPLVACLPCAHPSLAGSLKHCIYLGHVVPFHCLTSPSLQERKYSWVSPYDSCIQSWTHTLWFDVSGNTIWETNEGIERMCLKVGAWRDKMVIQSVSASSGKTGGCNKK